MAPHSLFVKAYMAHWLFSNATANSYAKAIANNPQSTDPVSVYTGGININYKNNRLQLLSIAVLTIAATVITC